MTIPFAARVVAAVAPLVGLGCTAGSTSTHMPRTLSRADLNDCYEVRLVHTASKHQEGWSPEERYEQLDIEISPRVQQTADYRLKRVGVPTWPSWSKFPFGEIEARSDDEGRRVWFVDRTNGKIIGSADREKGSTTGPDEAAPEWATADGGKRLPAPAR